LKSTLDGLKDAIGIDDRYFTPSTERIDGFDREGVILRIWDLADAHDLQIPVSFDDQARPQKWSRNARDLAAKLRIPVQRAEYLLADRGSRDEH
jgi:hypothetical protein